MRPVYTCLGLVTPCLVLASCAGDAPAAKLADKASARQTPPVAVEKAEPPPPAAEPEPPRPSEKEIGLLIKDLGDLDFKTRARASERLAAIGRRAASALEKAAETSADPEVKLRARKLFKGIIVWPPKGPEGLEGRPGWRVERWGNPATVTQEMRSAGDQVVIVKAQAPAGKPNLAVSVEVRMDFRSREHVTLNATNESQADVKLALAFRSEHGYHETVSAPVKAGAKDKALTFSLTAPTFKTKATNWQFTAPLKGANLVTHFYLVSYDLPEGGRLVVDRITAK